MVGQRLQETARATWNEIDLDKGIWSISGDRMKTGSAHLVPLAPGVLALLRGIPRGSGPFIFSSCGGRKPISGFSKLKARIDAVIPEAIAPWRFHDLRRTLRTGLSMLGVADVVSELVIAHAQKGLHSTYDRYSYLLEKRDALTRWEGHLRAIAEPVPENVVEFTGRGVR